MPRRLDEAHLLSFPPAIWLPRLGYGAVPFRPSVLVRSHSGYSDDIPPSRWLPFTPSGMDRRFISLNQSSSWFMAVRTRASVEATRCELQRPSTAVRSLQLSGDFRVHRLARG